MNESHKNDVVRLRHMLDAARKALQFVDGKSRDSLNNDDMLVFALVRAIEIVGEAAAQISDAYRNTNPQIPWRVIVAMRNRVIHAYFDVDLDIVWDTATMNLPPLVVELEKLLEQENGPT